jgi:hypothetical protein
MAALVGASMACALAFATYHVATPSKATARPTTPEIMALKDVKPGMKGHAVTVFSGTTSDRFEIEIVDVVPDFTPGSAAILFRALDPRLQHSGVVGGMSGSPIYIGDKMIGALAYGWRFNKDPLGGITPIEKMLEVGELPHRPEVQPVALGRELRSGGRADSMLRLGTSPLPARRPTDRGATGAVGMTPLGVPMSLGGFGPRTTLHLSEQLGFTPVAGGSGGGEPATADTRRDFQPGDSVSVVLIGGDNAAAPNGTVTWVGGRDRERILAFGHPLYGAGPSNLPIADARVHTIINSVDRSMKLASPRAIQGTLIQDRQPAISLRTDVVAPTIPVTTTIRGAEEGFETRTYESVVAVDPALTPTLIASLLMGGLEEAAGDQVELTTTLRHRVTLETSRGVRTISLEDELGFPSGIVPAPFYRSTAMQVIAKTLDNRFERGRVISVDQEAVVNYGVKVRRVAEIRIAAGDLRPGDLARLDIRLVHDRQPDAWVHLDVRIPDDVAGERVNIHVAGGLSVAPQPQLIGDVDELIDNLTSAYPARALVASVFSPQEGLATTQGVLEDLPPSLLESLDPISNSNRALRVKRAAHRVVQTPNLVYGEQSLTVEIGRRRISE